MNEYGYPTTLRHPRTMRQSGTEYANSIYRTPRDTDGITIVLVVGVVLALAIVGTWIGGLIA